MNTGAENPDYKTLLKDAWLQLKSLRRQVEMLENKQPEPVAIIGLGCRFPGAGCPAAFWELLRGGKDAITEVAPDRWDDASKAKMAAAQGAGPVNRFGGYLAGIDRFDPAFFGISPREAGRMDPQQRLLLEVGWEALEDAGLSPEALSGSNTAVFVGVSSHDYAHRQCNDVAHLDAYAGTGNAFSIIANRFSYFLNLKGPSVAVDTACSSSLVALHQACTSLRGGESDLAVAGGVNLALNPELNIVFGLANMLSPDGKCKTFDAEADGYVRGEGCGVVVLKRLSDALKDGDPVRAVIRGSAVNQDGRSNGLTAPNGLAQQAVIREALRAANVPPARVSYLEAHGTGTPLGDPIEVNALKAVLLEGRPAGDPCWLGSVKTNVGHLEAAAGMAGLIKTVLALQHREIPPHLNLQTLNPHISLRDTPLQIATSSQPWTVNAGTRVAGVSSFGFGGTNAHVVLEEAPAPENAGTAPARPAGVLALSARTEAALRETVQHYMDFLDGAAGPAFADVCHTAGAGRTHFAHRLSVVAAHGPEARERLAEWAAGRAARQVYQGQSPGNAPKVAFLFTGQGAQYAGMAGELYRTQPLFRRILDRCHEILGPLAGTSLLDVLFGPDAAALIDQTANTQPALFAVEYALAELWKSWGIAPAVVMGHSVGEYVAACVAGVFSLEDGLKLIAARAALMGALPAGGAMWSVMAAEAVVRPFVAAFPDSVAVAAVNGPAHVVLSGEAAQLARITGALAAKGITAKKLRVSHAFHSPLMAPMLAAFRAVAEGVAYAPPTIPVVSNLTGTLAGAEMASPDYWTGHVLGAVQFAGGMQTLEREACDAYLEAGPAPALLAMGKGCVPPNDRLWLPSLRANGADWPQLLQSLAQLYARGAAVDWKQVDAGFTPRKVSLPTYAFQRRRYWLREPADVPAAAAGGLPEPGLAGTGGHPLLGHPLDVPVENEVRYESSLTGGTPAFLRDHCVYSNIVFPATAYLETVLAAGGQLPEPGTLALENVLFQQALLLTEHRERRLQVVLTDETDNRFAFKIFSKEKGEPKLPWTLHASGKLRTGAPHPPEGVDVAALQNEFTDSLPVPEYYRRFSSRGIDYGYAFQGIQQLWRCRDRVLGFVRLPDGCAREAAQYTLHPALLDACLQVMAAAFADDDSGDAYMPVFAERVTVFERGAGALWSLAALRPAAANALTQTADLSLYTPAGTLAARVEGFTVRRATREALLKMNQPQFTDWLYEIDWQPQANECLPPDYLPAPAGVKEQVDGQLPELIQRYGLDPYQQTLRQLGGLSVDYAVAALRELGLPFRVGHAFSTEALAAEGGVLRPHYRLLHRLLEMLAESELLTHRDGAWQVTALPPAADTANASRQLLDRYPEARAEITLLSRCGARVAGVMRGTVDPLQLLFPDGDTSLTTQLYQDSPGARVMNGLVRQAVMQAVAALPAGRKLRVLEIGGGTGGTTAHLLPELANGSVAYVFTDVSPLFVYKAQEKFKGFPFVTYRVLDVEQPPGEQGFAAGAFDLVIAANVLHATRDLGRTVRHARQLLAPEGMLVLLEGTAKQGWLDLVFGLTEGWWWFTDTQLRPDYPLLTVPAWKGLLLDAGFHSVAHLSPPPTAGGPDPDQSVILAKAGPRADQPAGHWLLLAPAEADGVAEELAAELRAKGQTCTFVHPGASFEPLPNGAYRVNGAEGADFTQLLQREAAARTAPLRGVVYLWHPEPGALSGAEAVERGPVEACEGVVHLVQALAAGKSGDPAPALWLVTRGTQAVGSPPGTAGVFGSPVWGPGKVIALEHPELACKRIDLGPEPAAGEAKRLFGEIWANAPEEQVALRGPGRYVARLVRKGVPATKPFAFDAGSTYLITGGLGNLGLLTAGWMADQGARHLVLTGRSGAATEAARRQLRTLAAQGVQVRVVQADVADAAAVADLFRTIGQTGPPLKGVLHAAGNPGYDAVLDLDRAALRQVLRPKVAGAWLLHQHTQHLDLDFFVCYSSASSVWGSKGQGHYAAANHFLDTLAHHRAGLGLPALSVNWALWSGGMVSAEAQAQLERIGLKELAPAAALAALGTLMAAGAAQTTVADVDWRIFKELYEVHGTKPFLAHLQGQVPRERAGKSGGSNWLEQLKQTPAREQPGLLTAYLKEIVGEILGAAPAQVDVRQSLIAMGLDSLMGIALKNRIKTDLDLDIEVVRFMQDVNIGHLALELQAQVVVALPEAAASGDAGLAAVAESVAPDGGISAERAKDLLLEVNGYSDEEITRLLEQMAL